MEGIIIYGAIGGMDGMTEIGEVKNSKFLFSSRSKAEINFGIYKL
jgi:hypothetical protein